MALKNNNQVIYLNLDVTNEALLHIGGGEGEVLLNKLTQTPYIPGTSIAGTLKAYLVRVGEMELSKKYFGGSTTERESQESKVFVDDVILPGKRLEQRPGVKLNPKTLSAEGGGLFQFEYIGKGECFEIGLKAYVIEEEVQEIKDLFKEIAVAIEKGAIRFGAKKTQGAGKLKVKQAKIAHLDLMQNQDLYTYLKKEIPFQTMEVDKELIDSPYITFELIGKTTKPLLIKGQNRQDHYEPDGLPIKNVLGEYIIPGTSLKGALRARAMKIAKLFNQEELVYELFGNDSKDKDNKKIGQVYTQDVVIENAQEAIYNKIKIDRFRGGVMTSALMDEKTVQGQITIRLSYLPREAGADKETGLDKDKGVALIALLMRDIALGDLKFGSGQGVGRGKMQASKLVIEGLDKRVELCFDKLEDSQNIDRLQKCIDQLQIR